jgi:8-oxo-dGTP diphosphatase
VKEGFLKKSKNMLIGIWESTKMTQNEIVLVVSVSIIKENKVLMIKENKPFVRNLWNFPSGRIEQGEDILVAACREVKEETGFDVKLIQTTGVYNFTSITNHQVILFHFIGELIGGSLNFDEEEIIDCQWMPINELMVMEKKELREADVIRQIAEAIIDQQVYPMSVLKKQLN